MFGEKLPVKIEKYCFQSYNILFLQSTPVSILQKCHSRPILTIHFMYRAILSSNVVFRLVEIRSVNVIIDMNNVVIQNSYSCFIGLNFNISII